MKIYQSDSLAQTQMLGSIIFPQFTLPSCVYVDGVMGSGKTSLCQSIIQAAGYNGAVTSPTYNLIHEYPVAKGIIYHMDLYRLEDPQELMYLGLEDLWNDNCLFLIEWPDKGLGYLRHADYSLSITKGDDTSLTRSIKLDQIT